jgi:hypothetical protein
MLAGDVWSQHHNRGGSKDQAEGEHDEPRHPSIPRLLVTPVLPPLTILLFSTLLNLQIALLLLGLSPMHGKHTHAIFKMYIYTYWRYDYTLPGTKCAHVQP